MADRVKAIEWTGESLLLLEQRKLPAVVEMVRCDTYLDVARCIKDMVVRGAPAIGASAAYGLVLAAVEAAKCSFSPGKLRAHMNSAAEILKGTRPTAVNLFWAIERMMARADAVLENNPADTNGLAAVLALEADAIAREDVEINRRIGRNGADLLPREGGVLTHCNAGALATVDYGTALGVIRAAYESGARFMVYADETRPYLQGTRLTAFELLMDAIPVTLLTDNMAGYAMAKGLIQAVVVGADRITANGDAANKIGTYSVAVLAGYHGIPFYVAAPRSTIDMNLRSGLSIPIEQRNIEEVTHWRGELIAPEGVSVLNPAFDVTPAELITGIITEVGVAKPDYSSSIKRLMEI